MKLLRNYRLGFVVMLVPLALIAFWPRPVDQPIQGQIAVVFDLLHRNGIPSWFNYKFLEAFANTVLFVPYGFVGALAFPNKRWWQIGALGLALSGCMELGQLLFLPGRSSTPLDLVMNMAGAVTGAQLAALKVKNYRPAAFRRRTSRSR